MAAPKFAPVPPATPTRGYRSPDFVPSPWSSQRPAEIRGRQPEAEGLGRPGPDQGYALMLAERLRPQVVAQAGESVDDALRGALNIALRRAALYGRAPVIHDLRLALTMWGWFDAQPPGELVERRRSLFEGVANAVHHYSEGRRLADLVPESTLRLTPDQVTARWRTDWRQLTGA
jgi:hypothetical protein